MWKLYTFVSNLITSFSLNDGPYYTIDDKTQMIVDFFDENFKEECKYNFTMEPGKPNLHLNKYISSFFLLRVSLKAKKSWHMGAVWKNQVALGWIYRYQSDDGSRIETISNAVDKFFKDKLDYKMKRTVKRA